MRGGERVQDGMFSYVSWKGVFLRITLCDWCGSWRTGFFGSLSGEFDKLYAAMSRRSIVPEDILRGLLLQVFYSIRPERQLLKQLDYNLLFHWFDGLGVDDAVWYQAVFSRTVISCWAARQQFFNEVNWQAKRFMSDEHFAVDGTPIRAWVSQKSFRSKDGSDDVRLHKKSCGKESKLSCLGHALVESRNGLIAAAMAADAE